jgi:hypothetical protein
MGMRGYSAKGWSGSRHSEPEVVYVNLSRASGKRSLRRERSTDDGRRWPGTTSSELKAT